MVRHAYDLDDGVWRVSSGSAGVTSHLVDVALHLCFAQDRTRFTYQVFSPVLKSHDCLRLDVPLGGQDLDFIIELRSRFRIQVRFGKGALLLWKPPGCRHVVREEREKRKKGLVCALAPSLTVATQRHPHDTHERYAIMYP